MASPPFLRPSNLEAASPSSTISSLATTLPSALERRFSVLETLTELPEPAESVNIDITAENNLSAMESGGRHGAFAPKKPGRIMHFMSTLNLVETAKEREEGTADAVNRYMATDDAGVHKPKYWTKLLPKGAHVSKLFKKADNNHQIFANFTAHVKTKKAEEALGEKLPPYQQDPHLLFFGENGAVQFKDLVIDPRFKMKVVESIHLVLNANDWTTGQDDFYAIALGSFKGDSHRLKELAITIVGNTLFTRRTYVLAAGTMYSAYQKQLFGVSDKYDTWIKLYEGTADRRNLQDYPPTCSSGVKTIVNALMDIKNVPKVVIKGAMDTDLKEEICSTCQPAPNKEDEEEIIAPTVSRTVHGLNSLLQSITPDISESITLPNSPPTSPANKGKRAHPADGSTGKLLELAALCDAVDPITIEAGLSSSDKRRSSRIQIPGTIHEDVLPFVRDQKGRYALRSTIVPNTEPALSSLVNIPNAGKRRSGGSRASTGGNSTTSSLQAFNDNPLEHIAIDSASSSPFKQGTMEEVVRISAHRSKVPFDRNNNHSTTLVEGMHSACMLGWKVLWVPEAERWTVGREDELGGGGGWFGATLSLH